jgi:hypothetical protein
MADARAGEVQGQKYENNLYLTIFFSDIIPKANGLFPAPRPGK